MRKELLKPFNEEVLYSDEDTIRVCAKDIAYLKERSRTTTRRRIRLCAHDTPENSLHEMIIVHTKGTYIRPHKHLNREESVHIIDGTADIVIFHNDGSVSDIMKLGPYTSNGIFYYRLAEPMYHTLLIRSEIFVFHETTTGPFRPESNVFAPWSPEEHDPSVEDFIARIEEFVSTGV
jgi:cupin fold WbuC family metalloprotein